MVYQTQNALSPRRRMELEQANSIQYQNAVERAARYTESTDRAEREERKRIAAMKLHTAEREKEKYREGLISSMKSPRLRNPHASPRPTKSDTHGVQPVLKRASFNGTNTVKRSQETLGGEGTDIFTISLWVFVAELPEDYPVCIFSKGQRRPQFEQTPTLLIMPRTHNIRVGLSTVVADHQDLVSYSAITANAWTHVAITLNRKEITLYINGRKDARTHLHNRLRLNPCPLTIGGSDHHDGLIGVVSRFYWIPNVVLGAEFHQADAQDTPRLPGATTEPTQSTLGTTNGTSRTMIEPPREVIGLSFMWFDGKKSLEKPQWSLPDFDNGRSIIMTLSMWLYLTKDATDKYRTIFYKGPAGSSVECAPMLQLTPKINKLMFSMQAGIGSGRNIITMNDDIPLNQWCHIAVTIDTMETRIYINGKVAEKMKLNSKPVMTNQPLFVGNDPISHEGLTGFISNFRFYSRVLRPADIAEEASAANVPSRPYKPETPKPLESPDLSTSSQYNDEPIEKPPSPKYVRKDISQKRAIALAVDAQYVKQMNDDLERGRRADQMKRDRRDRMRREMEAVLEQQVHHKHERQKLEREEYHSMKDIVKAEDDEFKEAERLKAQRRREAAFEHRKYLVEQAKDTRLRRFLEPVAVSPNRDNPYSPRRLELPAGIPDSLLPVEGFHRMTVPGAEAGSDPLRSPRSHRGMVEHAGMSPSDVYTSPFFNERK